MVNKTEVNSVKDIACASSLKPFKRNRYFYGKLLTVRDFEDEQRYFIEKQRLINKLIHGEGVVCGLLVKEQVNNTNSGKKLITIEPGMALDCCGREIIVPTKETYELKGTGTFWVTLKYDACGVEPVASAVNANSCEESCCDSKIKEGYKVEIVKADNNPTECNYEKMDDICDLWPITEDMADMFTEQMQKSCGKSEESSLVLARIDENGNIDNTLYNDNNKEIEKKLVYTNPKLAELMRCGKKEDDVKEKKTFRIVSLNIKNNTQSTTNIGREVGISRHNNIIPPNVTPIIDKMSWMHNSDFEIIFEKDSTNKYKYKIKSLLFEDNNIYKVTFNDSIDMETIEKAPVIGAYLMGYKKDEYGEKIIKINQVYIPINITKVSTSSFEFKFVVSWDDNLKFIINSNKMGSGDLIKLYIYIKGDFILDKNKNALDANFIGGKFPTGNGTPGGVFETWVNLKIINPIL